MMIHRSGNPFMEPVDRITGAFELLREQARFSASRPKRISFFVSTSKWPGRIESGNQIICIAHSPRPTGNAGRFGRKSAALNRKRKTAIEPIHSQKPSFQRGECISSS
jgi:hypothetical protein